MITDKMIPAFQQTQGGLFSKVEQADVGDIAEQLSSGIAFLSWADPFYPNASTPAHVAQAMIDSIAKVLQEGMTPQAAAEWLADAVNTSLKESGELSAS